MDSCAQFLTMTPECAVRSRGSKKVVGGLKRAAFAAILFPATRTPMAKTKVGNGDTHANLGFEAKLWAAADALRNGLFLCGANILRAALDSDVDDRP